MPLIFRLFFILVESKLNWDSELVNKSMSHPPMYRTFKEYRKPLNERNLELLKYRYDFLQTIIESIKTVSRTPITYSLYVMGLVVHLKALSLLKLVIWDLLT